MGLGVTFCGANIKVASVVLESTVDSPAVVEQRLGCLKSADIPEVGSVAFMFACIGRGQHFFKGLMDVESSAFRKLFPTTPLFGFFGNGEIGFDSPPGVGNRENGDTDGVIGINDEALAVETVLHHSYSTIFVLLSLP